MTQNEINLEVTKFRVSLLRILLEKKEEMSEETFQAIVDRFKQAMELNLCEK